MPRRRNGNGNRSAKLDFVDNPVRRRIRANINVNASGDDFSIDLEAAKPALNGVRGLLESYQSYRLLKVEVHFDKRGAVGVPFRAGALVTEGEDPLPSSSIPAAFTWLAGTRQPSHRCISFSIGPQYRAGRFRATNAAPSTDTTTYLQGLMSGYNDALATGNSATVRVTCSWEVVGLPTDGVVPPPPLHL